MRLIAAAIALFVVACGGAGDAEESAESVSTGTLTKSATISYAPNSYVIGTAYSGNDDTLHGNAIHAGGPGNESGDDYQCGRISGAGFDHCGFVSSSAVSGKGDKNACGPECANGADQSLFVSTYTNGTITPELTGPVATKMYYGWSGCTDHEAYGNVSPWAVPAQPANKIGTVPNRHSLMWRYVSRDGNWALVLDPSPAPDFPSWYFVQATCINLYSDAIPPKSQCGTLQPGDTLALGESLASCGGGYDVVMQTDGNFVLYQSSTPLWSTATQGTNAYMVYMQYDGNLVLYSAGDAALWSTGTQGHANAYFAVQDDSNIVVYASDHATPLWARFGM